MTGGEVKIYSVRPHDGGGGEGEELSAVDAWIAYPSGVIIDLSNIGEMISRVISNDNNQLVPKSRSIGSDKSSDDHKITIKTAGGDNYYTLFWFLIFLIIVIVVFLIILLIIWCFCCSTPGYKK